jgi:hypothetical protein
VGVGSYGVSWHEQGEGVCEGRLRIDPAALVFDGHDADGVPTRREIPWGDLTGIDVVDDRDAGAGGRTLLLRRAGGDVAIRSAAARAGLVQELASALAESSLGPQRRAVVVVPLREGAAEGARALAAGGPPFDPAEAGLTRHELFVTETEAVFVFEALSGAALDGLLARLDLWAAAAAWRELVAGPPRLASIAYAWEGSGAAAGLGLGF